MLIMADETRNYDRYGCLKTKHTTRNVLWCIHDFASVCNERKNIRSELFNVSTLPNCFFYLAVTVKVNAFSLYLYKYGNNTLIRKPVEYIATIIISFEDTYKKLHFSKDFTMTKNDTYLSSSYDQSIFHNILVNGNLHVDCTVAVEENNFLDEQSHFEKLKFEIWSYCSVLSSNELKEHMEVLLDGDTSNKVTITAGGEDFPVHRTLLCSHSPVFSAMFSHDTLESQQKQIFINDISKEVIGEMLKYIYTGCTSVLPPLMNMELYIAADKYAIFSLKERCSNFLVSALNPELVLDVLVLSHQYQDENLKNSASQYLIEKASHILESKDFVLFIKNESEIVQAIILNLLQQQIKRKIELNH